MFVPPAKGVIAFAPRVVFRTACETSIMPAPSVASVHDYRIQRILPVSKMNSLTQRDGRMSHNELGGRATAPLVTVDSNNNDVSVRFGHPPPVPSPSGAAQTATWVAIGDFHAFLCGVLLQQRSNRGVLASLGCVHFDANFLPRHPPTQPDAQEFHTDPRGRWERMAGNRLVESAGNKKRFVRPTGARLRRSSPKVFFHTQRIFSFWEGGARTSPTQTRCPLPVWPRGRNESVQKENKGSCLTCSDLSLGPLKRLQPHWFRSVIQVLRTVHKVDFTDSFPSPRENEPP